jgi:hypothetical protein
VGDTLDRQTLTLATLTAERTWNLEQILSVVFVPLTGPHGWFQT